MYTTPVNMHMTVNVELLKVTIGSPSVLIAICIELPGITHILIRMFKTLFGAKT